MNKKAFSIISILLIAILMLWISGVCPARESIPSSDTFIKIARESAPAVVSIRVTKKTGRLVFKQREKSKEKESAPQEIPFEFFEKFFKDEVPYLFEEKEMEIPAAGSGLIVGEDGYIITNNHVIAKVKKNTIEVMLNDGRRFKDKDVEIVGTDPLTDLAVLKINAKGLKTIPWGDSDELEIGEWVLALGNPFELSGSVTQGIISAKHRVIHKAVLEDLIQTTAVINPGNSGGPLINLKGEVVGINTAIATSSGIWQGIGFAIPSNVARRVADEIIKYGQVRQGWIGIFMHKVNDEIASFYGLKRARGVLVMDVVPDSPADKADLRAYDVIVAMDGEEVKSPLDLLQKTASKTEGQKVKLSVIRLVDGEKKEMTIKLRLSRRPTEAEISKMYKKKTIPRTYDKLGLRVAELSEPGASGVEITGVKAKSPAAKAGLARGDVIVEINTRQINNLDDYRSAVKSPKNKRLLIKIIREGSEEVVVLKIK
ncbi:Do family serine endopeptidase [Candidatus Sumerlaeota bacterium]|nr:Do family serine endopeptidase [Candidatus Sumerlaeota bacterium]